MPQLAGMPLSVLDIAVADAVSATDFDLLAPRLPVLGARNDASSEPERQLDWPFTAQQVAQLVGR